MVKLVAIASDLLRFGSRGAPCSYGADDVTHMPSDPSCLYFAFTELKSADS